MAMKKRYHVELYGADELLIEEWVYDTKKEQLERYYLCLAEGHKKSDVIKLTREWI